MFYVILGGLLAVALYVIGWLHGAMKYEEIMQAELKKRGLLE